MTAKEAREKLNEKLNNNCEEIFKLINEAVENEKNYILIKENDDIRIEW